MLYKNPLSNTQTFSDKCNLTLHWHFICFHLVHVNWHLSCFQRLQVSPHLSCFYLSLLIFLALQLRFQALSSLPLHLLLSVTLQLEVQLMNTANEPNLSCRRDKKRFRKKRASLLMSINVQLTNWLHDLKASKLERRRLAAELCTSVLINGGVDEDLLGISRVV